MSTRGNDGWITPPHDSTRTSSVSATGQAGARDFDNHGAGGTLCRSETCHDGILPSGRSRRKHSSTRCGESARFRSGDRSRGAPSAEPRQVHPHADGRAANRRRPACDRLNQLKNAPAQRGEAQAASRNSSLSPSNSPLPCAWLTKISPCVMSLIRSARTNDDLLLLNGRLLSF